MGKLTSVRSAKTESFVYVPPDAAFGATRIIIKPTIGYIKGPPVTVSMTVLGAVLRGVRRANPGARILIIEGTNGKFEPLEILKSSGLLEIMDDNMRLANVEDLPMKPYINPLPEPYKFSEIIAPELFEEYDCRISVSAFKQATRDGNPYVEASMQNLYGLLPREHYALPDDPTERGQLTGDDAPDILRDLYFTLGHLFEGFVVDLNEMLVSDTARVDRGESIKIGQVVWGEDMIGTDESACRLAGVPVPDYLKTIDKLRK